MRVILLILTLSGLLFGAYSGSDIGGDSVVYDNATDLTWQNEPYTQAEQDARGANTESGKVLYWESAIDYCENLNFADKDDWRLPNFNELYMIADRSKVNPAMDIVFNLSVNVASSGYWSSTTLASDSSTAWLVLFDDGGGYWHPKNSSGYVRCVRSGQ